MVERISSSDTQPVPADAVELDAAGGSLLPVLADSHCHPFELGWLRRNVDLRGTSNITALRLRVAAKVQTTPQGTWIQGMGWDHEVFPEKRFPNRNDIDDVSPRNPVILSRVCGHIGLLNSKAIEALGLKSRQGEEYERDGSGALTGIVKERALVEAYSRIPGSSAFDCAADLTVVEYDAAKSGLGCIHTIMSPDGYKEELEALVRLATEGRLLLKHRAYLPPEALPVIAEANEKLRGSLARVNGVKLYADGSLGARTAALREPYTDDPGNSGLLRYSGEQLGQLVGKVDSQGLQAIIHAIGDRAVEQAIDALSPVSGNGNPRRHRIEHASLFPKDLRAKARKFGIRVAVQPSFIVSDTWAEERLGTERASDLYPLKSIFADGLVASGGSDAPVESISPIHGIWAAMAERSSRESLDLADAVTLYSRNAALNGFDEATELKEGAACDFTLLDSDVSAMHPALFRKVKVTSTIVAGELAYSALG